MIVPGIQYRYFGFSHHFFVCGIDFHSDAGNEIAYKEGKAKLVLCEDRTILRRNEPAIQPVTCRFPQQTLDCSSIYLHHHLPDRFSMECHSRRNGST